MCAPQNVSLSLNVNQRTDENSLNLTCEEDYMRFDWEKWINAALVLTKSHNQNVKQKIEAEGIVPVLGL